MMKRFVSALITAFILTAFTVTVSADGGTFWVSPDTGLEAYSLYMCYDVHNKDAHSVNVEFSEAVGGSAYSNFKDGKLWISVASASPIDCSGNIAKVTVLDDKGNTIKPQLSRSLYRINGKTVNDTLRVTLENLVKDSNGIKLSVKVEDELLRKNVTMCTALYNDNGKMVGIKLTKLDPSEVEEHYNIVCEAPSDAHMVKIMFLNDKLKPYTVPVFCSISEG